MARLVKNSVVAFLFVFITIFQVGESQIGGQQYANYCTDPNCDMRRQAMQNIPKYVVAINPDVRAAEVVHIVSMFSSPVTKTAVFSTTVRVQLKNQMSFDPKPWLMFMQMTFNSDGTYRGELHRMNVLDGTPGYAQSS